MIKIVEPGLRAALVYRLKHKTPVKPVGEVVDESVDYDTIVVPLNERRVIDSKAFWVGFHSDTIYISEEKTE